MRILWVKSDFLHPTNRGGQIRTLEMLRCLHREHELDYVGFREPGDEQGLSRSGEYCARAHPVDFHIPAKTSVRFQMQLAGSLVDPAPLAVGRFRSAAMRDTITRLLARERFDSVVCDFLVPVVNIPDMRKAVLFQHNVESVIWQRRTQHARNAVERAYLKLQADRMLRFERTSCREAAAVAAVSEIDASLMREMFGVERIQAIPTGVNLEYFTPGEPHEKTNDLVFIGSMDWAPNVDGMLWFAREILPLIRKSRPECGVKIVGRDPAAEIRKLAEEDPRIEVTGTVPDVRPYLWSSRVSIVPLRIGGGTRLKIYESMAARVPVVSTAVGAEGLVAEHPREIRRADEPERFAAECVALLENAGAREALAEAAWTLVRDRFSWTEVTRQFVELLERSRDGSPRSQTV